LRAAGEPLEAFRTRALHPGDREAIAGLELRSRKEIVQIGPQVPPYGLVIALAAFGETAAYRVAQQLKRGDALLDTGALPFSENALFSRRRVGFADAVATSRLNLAGKSADVAF
jgi:hypothetical protein